MRPIAVAVRQWPRSCVCIMLMTACQHDNLQELPLIRGGLIKQPAVAGRIARHWRRFLSQRSLAARTAPATQATELLHSQTPAGLPGSTALQAPAAASEHAKDAPEQQPPAAASAAAPESSGMLCTTMSCASASWRAALQQKSACSWLSSCPACAFVIKGYAQHRSCCRCKTIACSAHASLPSSAMACKRWLGSR